MEPDDWAIDQAIAEHVVYSTSGRLSVAIEANAADDQVQRFVFAWPGGEVQLCGAPADEVHWTVAYVPDGGEVITPLAAGTREVVTATWMRIRDTIDPREVPPPVVRFSDDVRRHFRPAHGRFLVGVAQEGASTILLAALGEKLAVVLLEGRRRVVLDVKAPLDLREIDVERMRRFMGLGAARAAEPRVAEEARVSSATQAHHIRITHGLATDVPGGPSIPDVVWRCFKGLIYRATTLRCEPRRCLHGHVDPVTQEPAEQLDPTAQEPAEQPARRRKGKRQRPAQEPAKRPARLKGKKYVRRLLRALFLCSLKGSLDLVGGTSVLLPAIQKHDPSFQITLEALADVLNLLRATGTCLVARPDGERIWHIHLVGLNDASSALHRRLLEETPIPFRFPAAATNEVLAEDDEATPTVVPATLAVVPATPSSSAAGGTTYSSPAEDPNAPADVGEQATPAQAPAGGGVVDPLGATSRDVDEPARDAAAENQPSVPATSAERKAGAGADPADRAVEVPKPVADGEHVRPPSSYSPVDGRTSSPRSLLWLLAVTLAGWEAALMRNHAEILGLREQMVAVSRELAELRGRGAVTGVVVEPVCEVQTPPQSNDPSPAGEQGEAGTGAWPDPAVGLIELDLNKLVVVSLADLPVPADEVVVSELVASGQGPAPPDVARAYVEVADFLAPAPWVWVARPSLGGLPISTLATRERREHVRHDWFGDEFDVCVAPVTPSCTLVLGTFRARGPPSSWR